jgi:hypothetical protein
MRILRNVLLCGFALMILPHTASAQEDSGPMMIKINRIVVKRQNTYAFYVPTFEFNMYFQRQFDNFRSAVTATYDYNRQDMGFGMSHVLTKFAINPGVSVDDNIYFRKVFSDSTGIWRRKQTITPFFLHEMTENASVGLEFKIEREWSPDRRMGTEIISTQDRSVRAYYVLQKYMNDPWRRRFFYLSFERSYKIFQGDFNYFILDTVFKFSKTISSFLHYQGTLRYRGNLTPQDSPLIFLGGRTNLIGYDNDEFWGRRVLYSQNLFQVVPFPELVFRIHNAEFRNIALHVQYDMGQVNGFSRLKDLKPQNTDLKMGYGIGIGINTDFPYMPGTDVHFLLASPVESSNDYKFYAGFGGWIN